jgi:hypothetical protein
MGWGPFGEAVYQTVLVVVLPIVGAGSAAIVLAPQGSRELDFLMRYHDLVLVGFGVVPLLLAFLLVKRLVWGYKGSRAAVAAAGLGNPRDRLICNLQFVTVLLGSTALPFIAAAYVHLVR